MKFLCGGRILSHYPTHNLVGQLLQFVWPFTQNLASTVEPTRDHRPNSYSFQGHQRTQISHHVKEQDLKMMMMMMIMWHTLSLIKLIF